jgi:hypothetical protein
MNMESFFTKQLTSNFSRIYLFMDLFIHTFKDYIWSSYWLKSLSYLVGYLVSAALLIQNQMVQQNGHVQSSSKQALP